MEPTGNFSRLEKGRGDDPVDSSVHLTCTDRVKNCASLKATTVGRTSVSANFFNWWPSGPLGPFFGGPVGPLSLHIGGPKAPSRL